MEAFGMIGISFGVMELMGFIFAIVAVSRIDKLEKKLKELGVLEKNFKSE